MGFRGTGIDRRVGNHAKDDPWPQEGIWCDVL